MATQNTITAVPASNPAAVPAQTRPSAASSIERSAPVNTIMPPSQGGADRVLLSSEAVNRAAREQQSQQPSALRAEAASQPEASAGKERRPPTGGTGTAANTVPAPAPAETHREKMVAQEQQRIENTQTVQNYTNASLYSRINGRKIDENI